jgi:hypothetical protein
MDLGNGRETLYKVIPPLQPMEGFYGYLGAMIVKKNGGLVQCHICGEFFNSVGKHSQLAHGVTAEEYRERFGIANNHPLCSKRVSSQIQNNPVYRTNEFREKVKRIHKPTDRKRIPNRKMVPSILNEKGLCKLQVATRFRVVQEMCGDYCVTLERIQQYDPKLLQGIKLHYDGSIEELRKEVFPGSGIRKNTKYKSFTDEYLIAFVRKLALESDGIIRHRDLKETKPSYWVMRERFGSFSKFMHIAGFERDYNMKSNPYRIIQ